MKTPAACRVSLAGFQDWRGGWDIGGAQICTGKGALWLVTEPAWPGVHPVHMQGQDEEETLHYLAHTALSHRETAYMSREDTGLISPR